MSDDRLDLTPLDPRGDPRLEARIASIVTAGMRARSEIHPLQIDSLTQVAAWSGPIFAAAAVIILSAVPLLLSARERSISGPAGASAAEILGIPSSLMELARSPQPPSIAQLSAALSPSTGPANER